MPKTKQYSGSITAFSDTTRSWQVAARLRPRITNINELRGHPQMLEGGHVAAQDTHQILVQDDIVKLAELDRTESRHARRDRSRTPLTSGCASSFPPYVRHRTAHSGTLDDNQYIDSCF